MTISFPRVMWLFHPMWFLFLLYNSNITISLLELYITELAIDSCTNKYNKIIKKNILQIHIFTWTIPINKENISSLPSIDIHCN